MSPSDSRNDGCGPTVSHVLDSAVELRLGASLLARYVYKDASPAREAPRPYFHPLTSLAGEVVTGFRPTDHLWHRGLSMTASYVSGENFWGGPSFERGRGYVQRSNNGRMRHERFWQLEKQGDELCIGEELVWETQDGRRWLSERRVMELGDVCRKTRSWRLRLESRLENVAGADLVFGSPTTQGRAKAGYGGLCWRGTRSQTNGLAFAEGDLEGAEEIMGRRARWLAYVAQHDETAAWTTVVFVNPERREGEPTTWFVRTEPFPIVAFAPAFHKERHLRDGDTHVYRHDVVIVDGKLDRPEVEQLVGVERG